VRDLGDCERLMLSVRREEEAVRAGAHVGNMKHKVVAAYNMASAVFERSCLCPLPVENIVILAPRLHL
jgi:hypothetical protein